MSYTQNTWHDGDTITASGLNNMETGIKNADTAASAAAAAAANAAPMHVPFTVTIGEGGILETTTTANYADVRAAYEAERTVEAVVTLPGGGAVMRTTTVIAASDSLTFDGVASNGSTASLYQITFSASDPVAVVLPLTVASS